MEDDLKKKIKKNGRRPKKNKKNEDDQKKMNGKQPLKKINQNQPNWL